MMTHTFPPRNRGEKGDNDKWTVLESLSKRKGLWHEELYTTAQPRSNTQSIPSKGKGKWAHSPYAIMGRKIKKFSSSHAVSKY
jgi:hypothetical protein